MKILHIFLIAILIFSCTPDSYKVIDNLVEKEDIKIIELRADSDRMLADGEAVMEFRTLAYGTREIKELYKEQVNENVVYHDSLRLDTFIIPQDQYPKNLIKVYDENDNLVEGNQFKLTEANVDKIKFYAKVGELKSKELEIKIREAADESYDEVVFPVIFHILTPPSYSVPDFKITTEVMQEKLDLLNVIFNKQRTTNPNGGNAKITFKLAKYDKYGGVLKQEGLNFVNISENLSPNDLMDYMKEKLMWDPNKYLNIWIGDISGTSWNSDGSKSYKVARPNVILENVDPIPGIDAETVSGYSLSDNTELTDIGIVYNKADFLRPERGNGTPFDFQPIGIVYYGIFSKVCI